MQCLSGMRVYNLALLYFGNFLFLSWYSNYMAVFFMIGTA